MHWGEIAMGAAGGGLLTAWWLADRWAARLQRLEDAALAEIEALEAKIELLEAELAVSRLASLSSFNEARRAFDLQPLTDTARERLER